MKGPTVAADHMRISISAIFEGTSCPSVKKLPAGGFMIQTGEPDAFGNFSISDSVSDLVLAAKELSGNEVLAMVVWPGPPKEELEEPILKCGFEHVGSIPAMTVSLTEIEDLEPPTGYQLERLTLEDEGAEWARIMAEAYPVAPLAARAMSPVHCQFDPSEDSKLHFFSMKYGSDIVGTSALVMTGDTAGVYCVATLPEHRNKGLGKVLTAGPLTYAKQRGCSTGVLQASEKGYKIYRELGFHDDGSVQLYLRTPAEPLHQ